MTFEVFDLDEDALEGRAIRKQVSIRLVKSDEPSIDLLIYLPKSALPPPVFLMLNFWGNYTISSDPKIRIKNRLDFMLRGEFFLSEKSRG